MVITQSVRSHFISTGLEMGKAAASLLLLAGAPRGDVIFASRQGSRHPVTSALTSMPVPNPITRPAINSMSRHLLAAFKVLIRAAIMAPTAVITATMIGSDIFSSSLCEQGPVAGFRLVCPRSYTQGPPARSVSQSLVPGYLYRPCRCLGLASATETKNTHLPRRRVGVMALQCLPPRRSCCPGQWLRLRRLRGVLACLIYVKYTTKLCTSQ